MAKPKYQRFEKVDDVIHATRVRGGLRTALPERFKGHIPFATFNHERLNKKFIIYAFNGMDESCWILVIEHEYIRNEYKLNMMVKNKSYMHVLIKISSILNQIQNKALYV